MKSLAVAALGIICSAFSALAEDSALNFDWGIVITNCVRDTDGIYVRFIANHPAPYFVGVYPVYDYADGGYIKEVAVSGNEAFIPGDFTDYPVNVKVLLASRIAEITDDGKWSDFHRKLTEDEVASYTSNCGSRLLPEKEYQHALVWGWDDYPILYAGSLAVPRYWSVGYNDIIYTNKASTATTTISFKDRPVPSAVAGESNVLYWTQSTITVSPYNPANYNNWCLKSNGHFYPEYLVYKDGPVFRLESDPITNSTVEIFGGEPFVRVSVPVPGDKLVLERGQILSRSNIAMPTFGAVGTPQYHWKPATNVWTRYEYNYGWNMSPMSWDVAPGQEITWNETGNRTNCSQSVYLPRLAKTIPSDSTQRVMTDYYGTLFVTTNAPSHWETDLGIVDMPPGSNDLFRINVIREEY